MPTTRKAANRSRCWRRLRMIRAPNSTPRAMPMMMARFEADMCATVHRDCCVEEHHSGRKVAARFRVIQKAMNSTATRLWPAALAAIAGSAMVGVMPLIARQLYAEGIGAPSMLFWRYWLALVALAIAAKAVRLDLRQAWRNGAWRIVLIGATLGTAQTLCFWESLKTLETSIAVLLFYTYPAVTLALDRLVFKQPIRPLAPFCLAGILGGTGVLTAPAL